MRSGTVPSLCRLLETVPLGQNGIMNSTHWRPCLTLALHLNRRSAQARYVQLATIREDGRPANRTVVFRGFVEGTDLLIFTADDRSRKVEQVERSPWAEACWYFPDSCEQFRLLGRSSVVRDGHLDRPLAEARLRTWRALADATRLSFEWPEPGGIRADAASFEVDPPDPEHPSPHFCLLLLAPVEVDHLELRGAPQDRWSYTFSDKDHWTVRAINP